MTLGIPGGLLFYDYENFIIDFFTNLGVETVFSLDSNQDILDKGVACCVDEACLPIKIFCGHAKRLADECDYIVVPRIKAGPGGESICPKFEGLPELVRSALKSNKCAFTEPLYLNDIRKVMKALAKGGGKLGISTKTVRDALIRAYVNHTDKEAWGGHQDYSSAGFLRNTIGRQPKALSDFVSRHNILLLGHTYNVYDSFANRNVVKKLGELGIGVITADRINPDRPRKWKGLMKQPYWQFFNDIYGAAVKAVEDEFVEGLIYLSSFNCGTDSITIDMIRPKMKGLPFLVLKLDEQTGDAGFQTRIEAFAELLERRRGIETYLPSSGRRPPHGQAILQ